MDSWIESLIQDLSEEIKKKTLSSMLSSYLVHTMKELQRTKVMLILQ
jgi:hypothetical protein